ncbi:MAG: hypothetical protein ACRDPT_15805 [Streptomycetales bacterium]
MTSTPYVRAADRVADGEPRLNGAGFDLAPLEGDWVSATNAPGGLSRVLLRQHDGELLIRAYGGGEPRPGDWGEVPAYPVFSDGPDSTTGFGFFAVFNGESVRTELQTYVGLGLLIVHAFWRFTDGSDRRNYFSREFFVRADAERPADDGRPDGGALPAALHTGCNDPAGLAGSWVNTDQAARGIGTIESTLRDGTLVLQPSGIGPDGPIDWGEASTSLYVDAANPSGPPALLATHDHGFMRIHLQARINIGVFVVAQYAEFTDASGRANYFMREVYRR